MTVCRRPGRGSGLRAGTARWSTARRAGGGGGHRRGWRDRSKTSKAPHASRTAALAMWSRSIMSDVGHPGAATAEGSDGLSFTGNQNGTCAN